MILHNLLSGINNYLVNEGQAFSTTILNLSSLIQDSLDKVEENEIDIETSSEIINSIPDRMSDFQIILLWDYLYYFSDRELFFLRKKLLECSSEIILYFLTYDNLQRVAQKPLIYSIEENAKLSLLISKDKRKSLLSLNKIKEVLPTFQSYKSSYFSNSMTEQLWINF